MGRYGNVLNLLLIFIGLFLARRLEPALQKETLTITLMLKAVFSSIYRVPEDKAFGICP
jgi:hypothetical protein